MPAVTASIFLSGCGNGDGAPEGDAPPSSPATSGESTAAAEGQSGTDQQARLQFGDQAGDGSSAVVDTVSAPQGGFVVVTTGDGTVLGTVPVQLGTAQDVLVPLEPALAQGATLVATLYADTDGNGAFDPAADRAVPEPVSGSGGTDGTDVVHDDAEYNLG